MIPNRILRLAPLALLIASSALVAACAGGGDDDDDVASTATPFCTPGSIGNTLAQLQTQVFTPNCALASCHDSTLPAGPGLDLSSTTATVGNVGVAAVQTFNGNAVDLIVAGNANSSYLYLKTVGATGIQGTRMPQASLPLCQEKIDKIAEWINAGAMNN